MAPKSYDSKDLKILFTGTLEKPREKNKLATKRNLEVCFQILLYRIDSVSKNGLTKDKEVLLENLRSILTDAKERWLAAGDNEDAWLFLKEFITTEFLKAYPFNLDNPWNQDLRQSLRKYFVEGREASLVFRAKRINYVVLGDKEYKLSDLKQVQSASLSLLKTYDDARRSNLTVLKKLEKEGYLEIERADPRSDNFKIILNKKFTDAAPWFLIY